ncbi:uncharacterized mitochondrial protein AtMg00820-like [Aristolochia californica]|uniref:uncharacterized mitochondrial protein AtMg00820-like n=1 Tax=Aristolochia californica TaxID=171875 RepID=UPI0035D8D84F
MSLSTSHIPRSVQEALYSPKWKQVMDDEMSASVSQGTWHLCDPPAGAAIVGCRWVYTIKYNVDGSIEQYKVQLVAKGYTQTFGVDVFETFSPVARLTLEYGLLGAKPIDTPMEVNYNLHDTQGPTLKDKTRYRRLVGKLIYVTVTKPNISLVVGVVSQFMENPQKFRLEAA